MRIYYHGFYYRIKESMRMCASACVDYVANRGNSIRCLHIVQSVPIVSMIIQSFDVAWRRKMLAIAAEHKCMLSECMRRIKCHYIK